VDCPAFNEPKLDQWINPMENSTLLFKNSSSLLTDTLALGKIQRSTTTQVSKGCMHPATGCHANLLFFDLQTASNVPKFTLTFDSFTGWDNNTTKQFTIEYKGLFVIGMGVTDTGFVTSTAGIQTMFSSTISLNGKSFSNVQLISADSSVKATGITQLYFARNVGIVAFKTYPAQELWVKQ
jgi:hypothetical protein